MSHPQPHPQAGEIAPNRTALLPALLADELVRSGLRHACIAPGSRSSPLVTALLGQRALRSWSHVDERSAGFFALGLARATRTPVAVVCTSGTAVANLHPAVVEAFHARVPLVVLTADRPPELRDCAAGQTIDQLGLFGSHVRWFVEVGTPEASVAAARWARALACRAFATAAGAAGNPAGPVHLNVALREPLEPRPVAGDIPAALASSGAPAHGRAGGVPWVRVGAARATAEPAALAELAAALLGARRPLIVAGPLDDGDARLPAAVAALADALGAPVLAEPASNLRRAPLAGAPQGQPAEASLVDAYDSVLRQPELASRLRPDAIVRLGTPPTSKVLATWLAGLDAPVHAVLDGSALWPDPASAATHVVHGAPRQTCDELARLLLGARGAAEQSRLASDEPGADRGARREKRGATDPAWREGWLAAGRDARRALQRAVGAEEMPFEAHAVATLARTLPEGALLYAGNSLAIRAVDAFWPASAPRIRLLANRGANGIDGFASSVLGAAAARGELGATAVVGLCGDLSFYHDQGGLLAARRYGLRAVFLVLDNDGGGIFDHLPIAEYRQGFTEFFTTPHGLDFRSVAETYGLRFARVRAEAELDAALEQALVAEQSTVIALSFDREHSRACYQRVAERVAGELAGDGP